MSFIGSHHPLPPPESSRKHHDERKNPSHVTSTKWIKGGVVDPQTLIPNIPQSSEGVRAEVYYETEPRTNLTPVIIVLGKVG